jgi:D-3-phosphoglycerate dehydrogenase
LIRSKTLVDQDLLEMADDLEFVGRAGAGVDMIDLEYLESRQITVLNAPEGNRDALAEHTVGMLLSLFHKVIQANNEVKTGYWRREENRGIELRGKTVGIYGFGYMGSGLAEKLQGFGCKVIYYDKESRSSDVATGVTLDEFMQQTEILSIHLPLTNETRGLFNKQYLQKFSRLSYVINTARGEVLELSDLLSLLRSGEIEGVCLDVLENEKLEKLTPEQRYCFDALVKLPQVVITPHVAGWTHESYHRISEVMAHKNEQLYSRRSVLASNQSD